MGEINSSEWPKTSVVMVSYHTGAILFDAIAAVLRQTASYELIVVNNGNPDDVMSRLREMARQYPKLKLMSGQGNIGFGKACNLGAKHAEGDYLLMLNPDCILPAEVLQKLFNSVRALRQPWMLGVRLVDDTGHELRGCRRRLLTPESAFNEAFLLHKFLPFFKAHRLNMHEDVLPSGLTSVEAISGAFMFMPRNDYNLINGFDEDYFLHVEDLDFCLRFGRAGGKIWFEPAINVFHQGGTSLVSSDFVEKCKAKSFALYFRKNFRNSYPAYVYWLMLVAIWTRYWIKRLLCAAR